MPKIDNHWVNSSPLLDRIVLETVGCSKYVLIHFASSQATVMPLAREMHRPSLWWFVFLIVPVLLPVSPSSDWAATAFSQNGSLDYQTAIFQAL